MEREDSSKRERGMKRKNGGVTERAVYWPRKCSQAAGQSAWLLPPVSLTAHWPMKAGLYSPFQSAAQTIKRGAVYLPLPSPTHPPSLAPLLLFLPLKAAPHTERPPMKSPPSAGTSCPLSDSTLKQPSTLTNSSFSPQNNGNHLHKCY